MAGKDLKIAVLVYSHGAWDARTGESVSKMVIHFAKCKYTAGSHDVTVIQGSGEVIPEVKHKLLGLALGWEATHIMMLPQNVSVPVDMIQRCLAMDGDVLVTTQDCLFMPSVVFDDLSLPIFHYEQVGETPGFHSENLPFLRSVTEKEFTVINLPELDKKIHKF